MGPPGCQLIQGETSQTPPLMTSQQSSGRLCLWTQSYVQAFSVISNYYKAGRRLVEHLNPNTRGFQHMHPAKASDWICKFLLHGRQQASSRIPTFLQIQLLSISSYISYYSNNMATLLGKLLLIAGLAFEAFNLASHQDTISRFNLNFQRGLTKIPLSSGITSSLSGKQDIARWVVFALYALSVLLIVVRSKLVKFLVLLGVVLNTAVLANPCLDRSDSVHFLLLQNLAIIGGLLYLLGQQSKGPSSDKNVKLPEKESPPANNGGSKEKKEEKRKKGEEKKRV